MSTQSPKPHRRSPAGFLGAWEDLVGPRGVPTVASRRGRKPRVPVAQLLPALTWHVMRDTGTLAEHLFQLFRAPLADSSWSDRRLRLPWAIFADLMRRALRPRATPSQHREAFWRGWRLIGATSARCRSAGREDSASAMGAGEKEGDPRQSGQAGVPRRTSTLFAARFAPHEPSCARCWVSDFSEAGLCSDLL
jgi:hypothetical protein